MEKSFGENNLEKIWSYNLNPPKLEESKDESTIHSHVDLTPFLEFLQECIDEDKLLMNLGVCMPNIRASLVKMNY